MGKANEKASANRKRVRFTKEFKLEAIRLLERGEKPWPESINCSQAVCES